MYDSILQFFGTHQAKILTLHILGTALGLGGATISDILFIKFLKDHRISEKEHEVLNILKTIVLGALFIIILSGLALYLPNTAIYNQSAPFLAKASAVLVVTINGIALHLFVAPHLIHLNLKHHQKMGRAWHRLAFSLGGISFVSWYTVFLIAMLKTLINWSFLSLIILYLILLIVGVLGSQAAEALLSQRAKRNEAKST